MASQAHVHAKRTSHSHAEELTQKAGEALRETIHDMRERGDDVKATVEEYVYQKPFKALGIAVLSGMALAFLLRR